MKGKTRKISKILFSVTMMLFALCMMDTNVEAAVTENSIFDHTTEERSLLDAIDSVQDTGYSRAKRSHLNFGAISLEKVSPTRARITGTTQAHHECPEVRLEIYVDRYNEKTESWELYRNWDYVGVNAQHVTRELEIIVVPGYYYSVRGVHVCTHGSVVETGRTQTKGLYIGFTDEPV